MSDQPYIEPFGFTVPDREEIEIFHESTKLTRANEVRFIPRISEYLGSVRGQLEVSRNRRRFPLAPSLALPAPVDAEAPLEQCLAARRSVRAFAPGPLSLAQVSQVLAGARVRQYQALNADGDLQIGLRAYPSGGGLYAIETYVALLQVEGMPPSLAHYNPHDHALDILESEIDPDRFILAAGDRTASGGSPLPRAPMIIFPAALFERSVVKYGRRGHRFTMLEAGMLMMVYSLSAFARGLGTLHWGGFYDDEVNDFFGLDGVGENVVDCLLVGKPAR